MLDRDPIAPMRVQSNPIRCPALFIDVEQTVGESILRWATQVYGAQHCVIHGATDVAPQSPFIMGQLRFVQAQQWLQDRYTFTFLRDPAERIVDLYWSHKRANGAPSMLHEVAQRHDLEEFLRVALTDPTLRMRLFNAQARQFADGSDEDEAAMHAASEQSVLNSAIDNISRLSQIGFVETFPRDLERVAAALGLQDQGRLASYKPSRSWMAEIEALSRDGQNRLDELTEIDRRLYEAAWVIRQPAQRRFVHVGHALHASASQAQTLEQTREHYLDLLQQCLTGALYRDGSGAPFGQRAFDPDARSHGLDWPERALTMVGDRRLENLRQLLDEVLREGVPGDLIETGVWRGGACILMRAMLLAQGESDRTVWVADSFEGLPPGNEALYPADRGSEFHQYRQLAVPLETVRSNFAAFGLLDPQVAFLKGWFRDTLHQAPIDRLALIRLDGDMYESTMDALMALYPRLSVNGYVIVDDYHVVPACRQAVHDYCDAVGVQPRIIEIDGVGVYWKKTAPCAHSALTEGVPTQSAGHRGDGSALQPVDGQSPALLSRLHQAMHALNQVTIRQLLLSLAQRDACLARERMHLLDLRQSRDQDHITIEGLERTAGHQSRLLRDIYASVSWRLTGLLRGVGRGLRTEGGRK